MRRYTGRRVCGILAAAVLAGCSVNGPEEPAAKPLATPEKARRVVRKARGAGSWYPAGKDQLKTMVEGYIQAAEVPKVEGRIVAAISPHAGYIYSGKVAGYVFRAIRENVAAGHVPDVVVVIGFTHGMSFSGTALMDGDVLATSVGEITLDAESGAFLAEQSPRIGFDYRPHDRGGIQGRPEHSADNEIPFVQAALPGVPLVVGLVGGHDAETRSDLVKALRALAKKKKVLVVASTDLLHNPDYNLVTKIDKATLGSIEKMDHKGLAGSWNYSNQVCCGIQPVLAVMEFAEGEGCAKASVLHYRNSGDDYPESRGSWVVGYGAVVFSSSSTE